MPAPRRASQAFFRARRRSISDLTVRIVNFKSIASVELPPAQLIVLAGSNSSGKSSLLQAALFVAQSMGEAAPVINGDLVRLGEPQDVLRDGTKPLTIEISFNETDAEGLETNVAVGVTLAAAEHSLRAQSFSLRVNGESVVGAEKDTCPAVLKKLLSDAEVPLKVRNPGAVGLPDESYLTVYGLQAGRILYPASEEAYRSTFDRLLSDEPNQRFILEDLLGRTLLSRIEDEVPEELRDRWSALRHGRGRPDELSEPERVALFGLYFSDEAPNGWDTEPVSLGPLGSGRAGPLYGYERTGPPELTAASSRMSDAVRRMDAWASAIVYLGPLRDDPRVAYPLGHTVTHLPVGEKGEFTAAYLENNSMARVNYRLPEGRQVNHHLLEAVSRWCDYLGIANKVDVHALGKLGHQLELELYGQTRDPTAIGVGASQLLPVVVLVLGAARGQTILLEQPELHLHPKVQSRLAEFLATARSDVRLLIETHSEYLITRLRLLAVQGRLETDALAVFFVAQKKVEHLYEDDGEEGVDVEVFSEFRRLNLDSSGDFDVWPDDFFDTLDKDSVALAHAVTEHFKNAGTPESTDHE